MRELAEILSLVDKTTGDKVMRLVSSYEIEIRHLKKQCESIRDRKIRQAITDRGKITKAVRIVYNCLRRGDDCALFYRAEVGQFVCFVNQARRDKEEKTSELIGVYTKPFNRQLILDDICESVPVECE